MIPDYRALVAKGYAYLAVGSGTLLAETNGEMEALEQALVAEPQLVG
jgi:hypothetical protein